MPIVKTEAVTIIDPSTGKEKTIKGLRRRECGTFTVRTGAVSKSFPDYEFSADFMVRGERFRSVLCRASDFADMVTFNREAGQWVNPALGHAEAKLDEYRRNAIEGNGPVRRRDEQEIKARRRATERAEAERQASIQASMATTVAHLVDKYDDFVKGRLKAYKSTRTHLERIRADLGEIMLKDLCLERIESWQSELRIKPRVSRKKANADHKKGRGEAKSDVLDPVSPVTVNRYLQTFKAMMTKACDWHLITDSQLRELRKIELVDERHNRRNDFLSREEAELLIKVADKSIKPIIIAALQTGMRKGELLSMRWSQVDLVHRLIHLPKTKSGDPRSLPINDRLESTLKKLPRGIANDSYVFVNPETGTRWSDLKSLFRRAVERAKLSHRGIVFHHLRHTAASWLVIARIPLLTVAKILGHSDIKMVMRYSHLSPGHVDAAMAMLDDNQSVLTAQNQ